MPLRSFLSVKTYLVFLFLSFSFLFLHSAVVQGVTYEEYKNSADSFAESRHSNFLADPLRPVYHLRTQSGWINDPCGLFYFDSSFHVFCQSNPWGDEWGNMTWSHIVSNPDKKWNYKWFYPVDSDGKTRTAAILPSLNIHAPDKNGIFTGCVQMLPFQEKDSEGKEFTSYYPVAVYSAVWGSGESTQEVICMARALEAGKTDEHGKLIDPYLTKWTKYSENKNDPDSNPAIILNQPVSLELISFRDPFIFTLPDDDKYYMIVSGGIALKDSNPKGVIILFSNDGSDVTKNWKEVNKPGDFFFSGETAVKDAVTGGGDFECGSLFRLTDHIGTTNETPYILIFGQDGPAADYGKSIFYVLGTISKSENSIKFIPLDNFKDKNGNPAYKHLDLNPDFVFYATQPMPLDNEQRHYLFGWLNISSQSPDSDKYSWAGMLSIPRFLFVFRNAEGEWALAQEPALVTALRLNKYPEFKHSFAKESSEVIVPDVKGVNLNIAAAFTLTSLKSRFGVKLLASENKSCSLKIEDGCLVVGDSSKIALNLPEKCSKVTMNIFTDGSSLEIFITASDADGRLLQSDVYSSPLPFESGKAGISVFAPDEAGVTVKSYQMDTCFEK